MLTEIAVLLCTLAVVVYAIKWVRQSRGLPPGPPRFPIIGSLPSLLLSSSRFHFQTFSEMAKTYGDVFTMYYPDKPAVIINSMSVARNALITQKDAFSGKPYLFTWHYISREGKGIGFADFSSTVVLNRKIIHNAFRMYKPNLEVKVLEEAEELSKRLQNHQSQSFDPMMDFSLATVNVIYSILYGTKHLGMHDFDFLEHVKFSVGVLRLLEPFNILNISPWLIHFPIPQSKLMHEVIQKRARITDDRYYEIKKTFQENQIRHLLDAFLQAKVDEEREDSSSRGVMTDDYVMASCDSLFLAGTATTSSSLLWLVAILLNYPHIQERIHAELREQFGRDKVSLKKKQDCHYLEATLTELLRWVSVGPLLPHKTTCDTTLSGYHIPKDTTVLLNYWAINHDEREWENPEEFNPDRFLDSEGHFTGATKMSYIPFGAGRRTCLGESLAKVELFLLSATMLQRFKFENPPGRLPPDLQDGMIGISFDPKPYQVIVKDR